MITDYASKIHREIYNCCKEEGESVAMMRYGLSKLALAGINKTVEKADGRKEEMGDFFGLNIRAYNALSRGGVKTIEQCVQLINSGNYIKIRGISKATAYEISQFLGEKGIEVTIPDDTSEIKRRTFHVEIALSDKFMEMPVKAQVLYFHLGMRSDGRGFVQNPKDIMDKVGCDGADLEILIKNGYTITENGGVIVAR